MGVLIRVGGFKCRRAFLGEGVLLACRLPVKDTDKCFAFARHASLTKALALCGIALQTGGEGLALAHVTCHADACALQRGQIQGLVYGVRCDGEWRQRREREGGIWKWKKETTNRL